MRRFLFAVLSLVSFITPSVYAQDIAVGDWRAHLSHVNGSCLADAGTIVYCGTQTSLYSYNKSTGDLKTYSKVNGFSGVGVAQLGYAPGVNTLVIAYDDANIDLLKGDEIINMSQIIDYPLTGIKKINGITIQGDSAILSCSFGVVIMDLRNEVVKTDVKFSDAAAFNGVECYDAAVLNGYYYFATTNGIYRVGVTQNIKNLSNWVKLTGLPNGTFNTLCSFNGKVYFNYSAKLTSGLDDQDTLYSYDGSTLLHVDNSMTVTLQHLEAANGKMTILYGSELRQMNGSGLITTVTNTCFSRALQAVAGSAGEYYIMCTYNSLFRYENGNCTIHVPDGPPTNHTFDMKIVNGDIWVAPGGITEQLGNLFYSGYLYYRRNNDWKTANIPDFGFTYNHTDIIRVEVDPSTPGHVYAGSWGTGFYEITNYATATQLSGPPLESAPSGYPYKIGGVVLDENGDLWVSNSQTDHLLKRRNAAGNWSSIGFGSLGNSNNYAGVVAVDELGQIWMAEPGRGIIVYDPSNGQYRLLRDTYNEGDLPNTYIRAIEGDLNGEIWVGSENGLRIFSPSQVLPPSNAINGQKIVIKAEDGNNELLLNETVINDIAVDGANRKWIATGGSGVRLVSEDGRKILLSFTEANSPLLSDHVNCIAIDHSTGEVYFGTDKGIISYRGDATVGSDSFGEVYAFPNPVKPDYNGPIVIKGMANNSTVKITDIAGNLMYQTESLGGQAVWNGLRYDGQRPQTGVYLVFCVNQDASETIITKILFIN